jgi:hypothetical protein
MKKLAVFLITILAVGVFSLNIKTAQAANIVSNQSGPWSSTSTWVGGVVPGNGDFVTIASGHTVTIDQNIGTAGNGIKTIRIAGGTLQASSTFGSTLTVTFGSTGSNPIGSGSETNPGSDATMHGFFIESGTLNLTGATSTPIVLTSQDDASPIYIQHRGDDTGVGAIDLTLKHVDARHLGTSGTTSFTGVYDYLGGSGVTPFLDIESCKFSDLYQINAQTAFDPTVVVTFNNNYLTGVRSSKAFYMSDGRSNNVTINDNTEDSPVATTTLVSFDYAPTGMNMLRNAVLGTATSPAGLLDTGLSSGGSDIIKNNLGLMPEVVPNTTANAIQFIKYGGADTTTPGTIDGNVGFGYEQSIVNYGQPEIKNNVMLQYEDGYYWQGVYFTYTGVANTHNNVAMIVDDGTGVNSGSICYWTYQNVSGIHVDHNTCVGTTTSPAGETGITAGEPGFPSSGNWARSNLLYNLLQNGIISYSAATSSWDVADAGFNGAAVHHNDIYPQITTSYNKYYTVPGFDNGTTTHPNALYGDLSVNPNFVDITRRPSKWDTSLGGAGTNANIIAQLSKRSGFGGSYNSAYNIPALLTYMQGGFAPTNLTLRGAGHDGADIGAIPVVGGYKAVGIKNGLLYYTQ